MEYLWHEIGSRDSDIQSKLAAFRNLDSLLNKFGEEVIRSYFSNGGASGAGASLSDSLAYPVGLAREVLEKKPKGGISTICMDLL